MATSMELLCPDWVILINSNVHVAKHKSWFSDYTPWPSKLGSIYGGDAGIPVLGIGTVNLQACIDGITTTITLQDVLHVPNYICNAIGQGIMKDYTVRFEKGAGGGLFTKSRQQIARTKQDHTLFAVDILPRTNHTFGPSVFVPGKAYMITCSWNKAEVHKWEMFKKTHLKAKGFDGTRLYKPAERKFLKDNYGGEFKFLRQHGLNIQKDEDRELGRAILRSVMHAEEAAED